MAPGSRLQELTAKYMQNPRRFFVPLANEYRKSNDLDRAIALCREHLPAQPGHMSGHIVLARAYFEKGDIDAAREVFITSVELDDENLIALRHLGDIARVRQDLTEARQWYARVLDADPQNEEIERLLRSLGSADAAADVVPLSATPFDAVPAPVDPASQASALSDVTPPGLRAITDAGAPAVRGDHETREFAADESSPAVRSTLDRFDLSTLSDDADASGAPAGDTGIRVDDGVGFLFDDLDELVDPAAAGATTGLSLPPVGEADFSAGVATPSQSQAPVVPDDPVPDKPVPDETVPDELMSRPGFGALASFASWRSAQERETPTQGTAQAAAATPPAAPPETAQEPSSGALFWESSAGDAAGTAPEFVTETMAALYARQGFFQQALDVYRALLARTPGDAQLTARVVEMQTALASGAGDTTLRREAEEALDFDEMTLVPGADAPSMLETMYEISPPPAGSADLDTAFTSGWDAADDGVDDWFADAPAPDLSGEGDFGGDELFGVSLEVFSQPTRPTGSGEFAASPVATATLDAVFGAPGLAAADVAAAEMLSLLATQMVGRLPKEPPTLPVPDVLELPSAVAGDEITGASPAPLLSFDRFFSGSGAPPRARIDTPAAVRPAAATPVLPPPVPAPSLSPTFGGVPVIPPPPASVTPATWAAFDQFLPPAASLGTPAAAAAVPPTPVVEFAPIATPVVHDIIAPVPVEPPASVAPDSPAESAPVRDEPPVAEPPRAAPPSEFHRWLEGLS